MAADRQHLHHRVLNIGHSYRQSVLIMYLWAALFSVTVVSLSVVRTRLIVFVAATAVAVLTLLPVTCPGCAPGGCWRRRPSGPARRPLRGAARPLPGMSRPRAAEPCLRPPARPQPPLAAGP